MAVADGAVDDGAGWGVDVDGAGMDVDFMSADDDVYDIMLTVRAARAICDLTVTHIERHARQSFQHSAV